MHLLFFSLLCKAGRCHSVSTGPWQAGTPWRSPTTTSAPSTTGITTSRVAGMAPAPAARWTTSPSSVILVGLLRYAHLLERLGPSLLNTLGLATGWVCAAGLTMVGSFQVDHAKVLHYIGAGVAFPTSMLFLLLQSILTYRMAKTRGQYWTGHLRSILTAVAFLTLVFSGVFFIQESFVLQHVAALCEWMFIIDVLVFYGTFTFEFGAISTDTFLVLLKASRAPKSYKGESGVSSTAHVHSHVEGLAMA
ncbi:transmembrane protein 150A isoform X2 [Haliaeetus albicilla]|uniref:transmembrane protein 150A isoform X2 n=1 Tax=Haliaeetus albicilla TaxID=8969 RepID=UPI0037E92EC0